MVARQPVVISLFTFYSNPMSEQGVVAIIPARGGSKRLPRKNLYPFFGRPLLQYAVAACQQAKLINRGVYVSTDDAEIASVARSLGAEIINRPAALAEDHIWTQEVLKHAVQVLQEKNVHFDAIARIHCSPYIESNKIDEAIYKLSAHRLWEVFSVNRQGIEDAVIHVLRKPNVFQKALSVYKGVVQTDYQDIHTIDDIRAAEKTHIDELERRSLEFLQQRAHEYNHASLWAEANYLIGRRYPWNWKIKTPLWCRWQAILIGSPTLRNFLEQPKAFAKAKKMRVLDLGSGFGIYWPLLREYGFRQFVGIDLFDKRARQAHYRATQAYVAHFCADCQTQLIVDDVRNLEQHPFRFSAFDLILNIATTATKGKSTGIPHSLFQEIVKKYGAQDCLAVHIEKAH